MNGRFRAVFLVLHVPDQTVVVKKELSHRAKLSIYWCVCVPTLSCGRELWAATEPDLREVEENRWMDVLLSNHFLSPFQGFGASLSCVHYFSTSDVNYPCAK